MRKQIEQNSSMEVCMTEKIFDNNQVELVGEVVSDFAFSHDVFGEGFYIIDVQTKRLSDSYDIIPVMVSERLLNLSECILGKFIAVSGQFRSYNRHDENKNRLILSVFAREVEIFDYEPEDVKPNYIYLDGYVCKQPVYRKTPLGREIADVLLAVNRPYGKSDYIPCICWGRNARYAENFEVGGRVIIWGRIQSREYQKKINELEIERRVAYEVSVSKLEYSSERDEFLEERLV
jgi:primosomal replication protein N